MKSALMVWEKGVLGASSCGVTFGAYFLSGVSAAFIGAGACLIMSILIERVAGYGRAP